MTASIHPSTHRIHTHVTPLQSDRDGQEARCEGSDPLRDLRGERVTGRVTEELHQADDAQEDRLLELEH